ncbi:transposase [Plakobranchus ocellatus]|uniref:Transposase n=1 Tax=Plakobranchus ocellatus TaxID=259542 RepID=A0AAV4B7E2_9GAST|nr:transposase [Plakobranchus ocellatus]
MVKCAFQTAVRKWVRIFKGEDPRERILRDRKRSGRPLSASVTAHQEKVDCMIRANRRVKQKEIANAIGISKEQVHHIVTTVLGYRKDFAGWVPRQLTVEMKAQRKDMCTQLLERYNAEGEAFLQRILTGDESWVNHFDPECKAQLMEYRHKTSPRKFKVVASARKVLFNVFWDMEGVVHMEFLEQGQTVNSERFISTLRALKLRLRRVWRDKDSILQHDNARLHTSRQTQDALSQLELTTLPHPAYSPDLAPSDYYLFPQLRKYLKGHHYDNDEEVIADVRKWCHGQSSEFFAEGVRQLVKRWRLCVDCDGRDKRTMRPPQRYRTEEDIVDSSDSYETKSESLADESSTPTPDAHSPTINFWTSTQTPTPCSFSS